MKMKKLERLIKRIQMQSGIKGLKHYKRPEINKDRKMCVIDVESKDTLERNIQEVNEEAIIDTGAEATVMTKGMMENLPYEIEEPSNINLVDFGKGKFRSLGKIREMDFFMGITKVTATVDIVDLPYRILLLG